MIGRKPPPMAVYGYCRVSAGRHAKEGESLDIQRRKIASYAHLHGLPLTDVVYERVVSGSIPLGERPAGRVLLGKLKTGDILIAANLARMFRSALDALRTVKSLKEQGVGLHLPDLGGDVAGEGVGKLFLTIISALAEAERDWTRERMADVKADQRARNRYLGGIVPFGFRRGPAGELVEHPGEQEAIREMYALRRSGRSLRAIAAEMQSWGHKISHQGVSDVLKLFEPFASDAEVATRTHSRIRSEISKKRKQLPRKPKATSQTSE